MYFSICLALIWNAISVPIAFMVCDEVVKRGNYSELFALFVPFVGIWLAVWAARQTRDWRRIGNAPVSLDPFPGSIGGHVGGTIELNCSSDTESQFIVTLSCLYCYKSYGRSGESVSWQENTLWQDTAVAYAEEGLYGTRIVFLFDVPEGLAPSDAGKAGHGHHLWRLSLTGEAQGIDVNRCYEIPVYPTRQKSARIPDRAIAASERGTLERDVRKASTRFIVRPGPQGEEILYPMGRNLRAAFLGIFIGSVCTLSGVLGLWLEKAYFSGGIVLGIGMLALFAAFYSSLNSLTVSKDGKGGIHSVRRILGKPVKLSHAWVEDIQSLSSESFSAGWSSNQNKNFAIYANIRGKKKMVLGEGFHGAGEAKAAIGLIRDKLGIRQT